MLRRTFISAGLAVTALCISLREYDHWQSQQPFKEDTLPSLDELCEVTGFLSQEADIVCLGDTHHKNETPSIFLGSKARLQRMEQAGIHNIFIEAASDHEKLYAAVQDGLCKKTDPQYIRFVNEPKNGWIPPYQDRRRSELFIEAIHNQPRPRITPVDDRVYHADETLGKIPSVVICLGKLFQEITMPETMPSAYAINPGVELAKFLSPQKNHSSLFRFDSQAAMKMIEKHDKKKGGDLLIYGAAHFLMSGETCFLPTFKRAGLKSLWVNYFPDTQAKVTYEEAVDQFRTTNKQATNEPDISFIAKPENGPILVIQNKELHAKYVKAFAKNPKMLALVETQPAQTEKRAVLSRRNFLRMRLA